VTQVELSYKSLNSGDVFILDAGMDIFQWNGSKAGIHEKSKGAQVARAIDDERKGLPKVTVIEESEKAVATDPFWKVRRIHRDYTGDHMRLYWRSYRNFVDQAAA
jgi:gelsolin